MPPKTERDGAIVAAPSRLVETVRLTPTETLDGVAREMESPNSGQPTTEFQPLSWSLQGRGTEFRGLDRYGWRDCAWKGPEKTVLNCGLVVVNSLHREEHERR